MNIGVANHSVDQSILEISIRFRSRGRIICVMMRLRLRRASVQAPVDERDLSILPNISKVFYLNNEPDAPIIQIYSVVKLYMFRASSLPIIGSSLLCIRHW